MPNSNAPEHTRFRKLVHRSFSLGVIAGMRGQVELLVLNSLSSLPQSEPIDWVTLLAY